MAQDPSWANPNTTRSLIVLEIAADMVSEKGKRRQAKVELRDQGTRDWTLCLLGSSTNESIEAVVAGEAALSLINPVGPLAVAYQGTGPYDGPQPVRSIGVIPSYDQYVFAVRPETGLTTFEQIGERRAPLKVSLRGYPDHCLHFMLSHIAEAAGFSVDDIDAWGGAVRREGGLPGPDSAKFQALLNGEIDAIFDEAADLWVDEAAEAGMTILPLAEATVVKLEAMGYRRGIIERRLYPNLPGDILSIDFSGWPIFVHAELDDELVVRICSGLDARKHLIPWQGEGPLPVERMCREAPDTPQDVPLHPTAERFWRERGYLS